MWPSPDTLEISAAAVAALKDSGENVRIIDCREQEEWRICRMEGAELVPLSAFAELAPGRFPSPGEKVVVYCHHGMRSQHAAHFLRQRGLAVAWSMAGGIDRWALEQEPGMPRY